LRRLVPVLAVAVVLLVRWLAWPRSPEPRNVERGEAPEPERTVDPGPAEQAAPPAAPAQPEDEEGKETGEAKDAPPSGPHFTMRVEELAGLEKPPFADVRLIGPDGKWRTRTIFHFDEKGVVRAGPLARYRDRTYAVLVLVPELRKYLELRDVRPDGSVRDLQLEEGVPLTGEVRLPRGVEWTHIAVRARDGVFEFDARTDEAGRFELPVLPPREFELLVSAWNGGDLVANDRRRGAAGSHVVVDLRPK